MTENEHWNYIGTFINVLVKRYREAEKELNILKGAEYPKLDMSSNNAHNLIEMRLTDQEAEEYLRLHRKIRVPSIGEIRNQEKHVKEAEYKLNEARLKMFSWLDNKSNPYKYIFNQAHEHFQNRQVLEVRPVKNTGLCNLDIACNYARYRGDVLNIC